MRTYFPIVRSSAGFTLIEVILAISITTGLLIVALLLYRQASELRGQILGESERLGVVRLVMDRMVADLRTILPMDSVEDGFSGDSTSMAFTKSAVGNPQAVSAAGIGGESDLVRVIFSVVRSRGDGGESVTGFKRVERPLAAGPEIPLRAEEKGGSLYPGSTNGSTQRLEEPQTDLIRYLRFRYWDGGVWLAGWTNVSPPAGVEIVLGMEPMPADAVGEEYPFEQFRRVVFVPTGEARRDPSAGLRLDRAAP